MIYLITTNPLMFIYYLFLVRRHPKEYSETHVVCFIPPWQLNKTQGNGLTLLEDALLAKNFGLVDGLLHAGARLSPHAKLNNVQGEERSALEIAIFSLSELRVEKIISAGALLTRQTVKKILDRGVLLQTTVNLLQQECQKLMGELLEEAVSEMTVQGSVPEHWVNLVNNVWYYFRLKLSPAQLRELILSQQLTTVDKCFALSEAFLAGYYSQEDWNDHTLCSSIWQSQPAEDLLCLLYRNGFPTDIMPGQSHPLIYCAQWNYQKLVQIILNRVRIIPEHVILSITLADTSPDKAISLAVNEHSLRTLYTA